MNPIQDTNHFYVVTGLSYHGDVQTVLELGVDKNPYSYSTRHLPLSL